MYFQYMSSHYKKIAMGSHLYKPESLKVGLGDDAPLSEGPIKCSNL